MFLQIFASALVWLSPLVSQGVTLFLRLHGSFIPSSSTTCSAFFLFSGLGLVVLSKTPSWLLAANTLTYILAFGEFSFGPDIITDPPGARIWLATAAPRRQT